MAVLRLTLIYCMCGSLYAMDDFSTRETMITDNRANPDRDNSIAPCPTQCSCYLTQLPASAYNVHPNHDLAAMDCSSNGLLQQPAVIPNNIGVVFIFNNTLTQLTQLQHSPKLLYLDASNNLINSVDANAFSKLLKLQYLSLKGNKLSSLPSNVFNDLKELQTLDLSANKLKHIYANLFENLGQLKSLKLADNGIMKVQTPLFESLSELRELDLSGNDIIVINDDTLAGLENLNLLNLSSNRIRKIEDNAFDVLNNLLVLDLNENLLQFVPTTPLQSTNLLKKLSLNGNKMRKIHEGAFKDLKVSSVSISYMPNLQIVDRLAFQNMPHLTTVEMHDNQWLIFIDSYAFHNVPSLKSLYIHNNQLTALSPKILKYVPSLDEIHLYRNPLRCDCNSFWIKELLEEVKDNNISRPFLNHSNFIKCDFPLNYTGVSIADVDVDQFPRVCTATTLPLFHENYTMDLGEELRLECRSYGVPEPTMSWLLPNGTDIKRDVEGKKFEIVQKSVLIIRYLSVEDGGVYACKADNGIGYDISSTRITVTNKPVKLVLYKLGYDYISLSWNSSQHSSFISDYQLHYREIKTGDSEADKPQDTKYKVIPLGARYKSYTVTNLMPKTDYEFCIIFVYDTEYYKVDCEEFRTRSNMEYHNAIKKVISEKIIAGVCTALGLIMVIVCMVTLARKFRLHKDYETPYGAYEPDTINIPLENVYQPLSTPLCSSKTSLLNMHSGKSHFDDY